MRPIAATVNTLYYQTTARSAAIDFRETALALAFGVSVSVIAGWLPAREASRVPPALGVSTGTRGGGLKILQNPILGIAVIVAATVFSFLPAWKTGSGQVIPLGGYIGAFLFLAGLGILVGALFPIVTRLLRWGKNPTPERSYAASQFRVPEGRHRLAAAGLLTAFGMSAAMGILVASFESTLTAWIGQMLRADVYIAAAGGESITNDGKIPEPLWREIRDRPGVAGMDRIRRYPITFQGKDAILAGSHYNKSGRWLRLIWLSPPKDKSPAALEEKIENLHPAWISEGFARQFKKRVGDQFSIPTPSGQRWYKSLGFMPTTGVKLEPS